MVDISFSAAIGGRTADARLPGPAADEAGNATAAATTSPTTADDGPRTFQSAATATNWGTRWDLLLEFGGTFDIRFSHPFRHDPWPATTTIPNAATPAATADD